MNDVIAPVRATTVIKLAIFFEIVDDDLNLDVRFCFNCAEPGHVARICPVPLNYKGMIQTLVEVAIIPLYKYQLNNIDINHQFVDCQLDGVPVRALVDIGSLKSFISYNVQRIIDFNDNLLDKSSA